jgi:hypothetical protein
MLDACESQVLGMAWHFYRSGAGPGLVSRSQRDKVRHADKQGGVRQGQ